MPKQILAIFEAHPRRAQAATKRVLKIMHTRVR
jgi:hypothetical protein